MMTADQDICLDDVDSLLMKVDDPSYLDQHPEVNSALKRIIATTPTLAQQFSERILANLPAVSHPLPLIDTIVFAIEFCGEEYAEHVVTGLLSYIRLQQDWHVGLQVSSDLALAVISPDMQTIVFKNMFSSLEAIDEANFPSLLRAILRFPANIIELHITDIRHQVGTCCLRSRDIVHS
jgi:hypothetical protein